MRYSIFIILILSAIGASTRMAAAEETYFGASTIRVPHTVAVALQYVVSTSYSFDREFMVKLLKTVKDVSVLQGIETIADSRILSKKCS